MVYDPERDAANGPGSVARETRASTVWVDAQGVHRVRMKPVGRFTLDDARALHLVRSELADGHATLVLVDIGARTMPTTEARAFGKTAEAVALTKALALYSPSQLVRVLGNAALSMFKGSYPVRIFSDESQALAWLEEHR